MVLILPQSKHIIYQYNQFVCDKSTEKKFRLTLNHIVLGYILPNTKASPPSTRSFQPPVTLVRTKCQRIRAIEDLVVDDRNSNQ